MPPVAERLEGRRIVDFEGLTTSQAQERLSELYADHSRPLLNFLLRLTNGERTAAEDLLQETMIRAWRHLETVPTEPENIRRWLFTVARRVTIDAVRMRQARPAETPCWTSHAC